MRDDLKSAVVCIVGLGYVGFPLAVAFAKHFKVVGFDINGEKIKQLSKYSSAGLTLTNDPGEIGKADFIIIAVPTPVLTYPMSSVQLEL